MTRALAVLCIVLLGCGGGLRAAKSDFQSGDYGDARERLEKLEVESAGWNVADRASYALYRGLTHHALGDRRRAITWLQKAKSLEDARPHTLSADDFTRLELALEALGPEANAPE